MFFDDFPSAKIRKITRLVLGSLFLLSACLPRTITLDEQKSAPTPLVDSSANPPQETVIEFLEAWKNDDYPRMYECLTPISQDTLTEEMFSEFYQEAAIDLTLQRLDFDLLSTLIQTNNAQVASRITYHSILMDEFEREIIFNLSFEKNQWKIQWHQGLILPELSTDNQLAVDISVPARGNIYDNEGNAIVVQSRAYAIGISPSQINRSEHDELWEYLSLLSGKSIEFIDQQYDFHRADSYIAIGDISEQELNSLEAPEHEFSGLILQPYETRYYLEHGIAPQTIGYTMLIPAEVLEDYRRLGYRGDEKVGMSGLEKWSENDLMGQRGADVYVVDANGDIVTRLSHRETAPAKSIYTTLDRHLQIEAQKAMDGFSGALVVLERDSGRVLAIVSAPHFDPNVFDAGNFNSSVFLSDLLNDGQKRLLNRATQGVYPLGSVFKVITLGAALESGFYTQNSKYNCTYEWNEIPGLVLYDWTYEKGAAASGVISLTEGLMRSCNPWFWHIGLDLYFNHETDDVSKMARAFGLGKATGILAVSEDSGSIEDPADEGDAIQMAIGQGTVLVTPLQVAVFTAALGNGGTLYRPQIIEKIASPDGQTSFVFQPEIKGQLPLTEENLEIIQNSMHGVIENEHGTAYTRFLGMDIPVFGKTGTAQNPHGDSHAWFAAYTDAGLPDRPDIAVVALAENAGEGSDIAAPIVRRILEVYYFGKPTTLFPWEKSLYQAYTPTPESEITADGESNTNRRNETPEP